MTDTAPDHSLPPSHALTTEEIESQVDFAGEGSGLTPTPTEPHQAPELEISRRKRIAQSIGWVAFGLASLFLFTLIKLPEDRIKNYVQGMIAAQLAPKGITLTAERGYLSVGWGITYVMKDVSLTFPSPESTTKIEKITLTPSLLPMIFGYQGGNLWVEQGDGSLYASVSMKGTQISASLKAKSIDVGKVGLLNLAAGVRGSAVWSGTASLAGDFSIPSTLTGDVDLTVGKISLDQQSILGFNVPKIQLSEGRIEVTADKGKATIKQFKLGKPGSGDDLQASGTGDVLLGRNWDSSNLNAKTNFRFSESVSKAFVLLDALLGAGKQTDGSYTFALSGPLSAPQFLPTAK